ncbi:LOW QUALITY PROTEIN: hypothetical protein N665_0077s0010 [Sinapis alba]|nr:LOW QUALITY PROTEIN: hypothetical protein N665_0077s0010 [Sinapis alba]
MIIYNASSQSITCGVTILSQNLSFTVTFVYAFNQVEERISLWENLVDMQGTTPVSVHPWSVVGDFNQMLRTSHHSNHLSSRVDESGMSDANIALQDAELFEAQGKGLPFTWRNNQDDNPISTKIDHAFIDQSSAFPDSYADFLDPSQSDHAPCFFRMPSATRQVVKPFKFFHHVMDHPEYTGTKLKRPLRNLNKRHYSGITQRVRAQKVKVDELQRTLLTTPNVTTAREEHTERNTLNLLLNAESKYFKQRSRECWAEVGDRNTTFYHQTVSQHAARNHIHFLKGGADQTLFLLDDIKAHAADYFQAILGTMDLTYYSSTTKDLRSLLPFRCTELQQNYLKREVTAAEIKATLFSMPLNKSPGHDGYSVEFLRGSWDTVGEDITNAVWDFFGMGSS